MKINKTICIQGVIFLCCAVVGFAITHTMTADNGQEIADNGGGGGVQPPTPQPLPIPDPAPSPQRDTGVMTEPSNSPLPPTPTLEDPKESLSKAEPVKEPQVVQMTPAEATNILNSGSHELDGIPVVVQNPAQNENSTVSVSMARAYLKTGVWSSVSVVSLVPGPKGKPSSVTIHVTHNED